ncbi:MAG: DNA-binding response regulator [Zetaproteobacteria bacterium]|nr:MAG: DNA-binding response regulator [Zetaproteobacteria bacterium]
MPQPHPILIVEDNPEVRHYLRHAIEEHPQLTVADAVGDCTAARAALMKPQPIRVMLVDLGLPDGSGIELIRQARDRGIESMVITIHDDRRHVLEALEAGATGYILKDDLRGRLAQTILDLIAGGSPMSPMIARTLLTRLTTAHNDTGWKPQGADPLSDRERLILQLLADGCARKAIAVKLGISPHTVHSYIKKIYRKLQAHSNLEAVHRARTRGLLD